MAANPEPPDRVSEPDQEPCIARSGSRCWTPSAPWDGVGLALDDADAAPENLPRHLHREFYRCAFSRQGDEHPVGDEDGSETQAARGNA